MKKRYFYVAYLFTVKNHQGDTISTGYGSIRLWTVNGQPINHSMKTMREATRYIEDIIKKDYNFLYVEVTILNVIELVEGEE